MSVAVIAMNLCSKQECTRYKQLGVFLFCFVCLIFPTCAPFADIQSKKDLPVVYELY